MNLLWTGMIAVLSCSIGNGQIIYSNNFALGGPGNISNTPPTVANTYAGGTNNAVWTDALGPNDSGYLAANGVDNCTLGDSWILPFIPTNGHIYRLDVTATFYGEPGNWIGAGFAQNLPTNANNGFGRFSDGGSTPPSQGPNGYVWEIIAETSANVQMFTGPGGTPAGGYFGQNGFFTPGPGTHTMSLVLNTMTNSWKMAAYVDGKTGGAGGTFTSNAPIHAVGITVNAAGNPTNVVWNSLALYTTLAPYIVQEPTNSQTLSSGQNYSDSVTVASDPAGGTLSYQWYVNGLPIANGGAISGATTNVLKINPAVTANEATNYYVIVTNNYGAVTSTLSSLIILTNPMIVAPVSPTNSIILFGGTNVDGTNYVGSSPTFSVTAVGAPTLTYEWLTNGVVIGGETNNSLTFTNSQLDGPTNFTCVVSNSFGQATSTWSATYITAPFAGYPQAVLADQPRDFWRLNEADDGNGNLGAVCHDYQSGANGSFTNVTLGESGYDALEPTETSMFASAGLTQPSCVKGIVSADLAATMTNGVNAGFAVEAWANCISGNGTAGGAPVIGQGLFGGNTFFLGVDTSASTKHYEFYVRSAGGTVYTADDTTIEADDLNWHYLAGVCDQAHTNISLYIDGQLVASASIPAKAGLFESGMPVAIGAGIRSGASDYNVPFTGNIDDVAIYNRPLSAGQVVAHYVTTGNLVPVSFDPPAPPTNFAYLANQTMTIPAMVSGSGPIGYYWTNVTTGGAALASGGTNSSGGSLDVTLTIPNAPTDLSGDQLELVVTNPISSTNCFVTLFNPPPPVTVDYSNPILYSNYFDGGSWSLSGMSPTIVNALVGGTNTLWNDSAGTNATTGVMQASGTPTSMGQDSWVLPFTPHVGYIYTISASATFTGNPNNWIAVGFFQNLVTNATDARINGGGNGVDWLLVQYSGNVQYFVGPAGGGGTIKNATIAYPGATNHTIQIVLDTTTTDSANWMYYAFVDGTSAGTNKLGAKPTIRGVGIAQNGNSSFAPWNYKWNSFMLTQVAPGGVPPYTLASVPANVTLLADSSLSIPATAFGSAPFGYYWSNTNTAAVLGSGVTNTMAPLTADLSVADVPSGWNGNTLALILTNAYGTNISLVSLIVTNPTVILTNIPTITGFSLVGGTNVVITATNGQSGGKYYLLGSTNIVTSLSQWLPLATNVIVTNGSAGGFTFTGTNVVNLATPQEFYILSNTN